MLERSGYVAANRLITRWIEEYFSRLESLPVKSSVAPGDIYRALPDSIPLQGESMSTILKDLDQIIMPGITHWQHPNFHAYFPANSSVESLLAEEITAAIGAQCMMWETAPAAAELEQRVLEWLRDAMGLPVSWSGVIQDTASAATLSALLTAREVATNFRSNQDGVPGHLRVYCTDQTHSSVAKAVAIAGIGKNNLVAIPVDEHLAMQPQALAAQMQQDLLSGKKPCCVVATIGTTGTMAIDVVKDIAPICAAQRVWLHIDAAYAGTALLLPEFQWMIEGIETADSFVFNPHKWMFTNFDCTAYYVKNTESLLRTFEMLPEYLKTPTRGLVNDYRDWGIALGRRFRALKLWFVMRSYGLGGIQRRLRQHIELSKYFVTQIEASDCFELLFPPVLNFTALRLKPTLEHLDTESLNQLNRTFLQVINDSGRAFLSHTVVDGRYVIRVLIGQTYVEKRHVDELLDLLITSAKVVLDQIST